MNRQPDFIAELKYRTTDQGGRRTAAFSGYRPQIKFAFSEMMTSGHQKFIDKEIVHPGETVIAEIVINSPEFFKNRLKAGTEFEFREGASVIGTGIIREIFNIDLLA